MLVGFLLATGAFGIFWFLNNLNAVALATCQGDPMSVGDVCGFRSRRTGSYERTYEQMLATSAAGIEGASLPG